MNEKEKILKILVAELKRDVPNLEATVGRVSIEVIEMAGIVQNSFARFNSLVASSPELFQDIRRFTSTILMPRSFRSGRSVKDSAVTTALAEAF